MLPLPGDGLEALPYFCDTDGEDDDGEQCNDRYGLDLASWVAASIPSPLSETGHAQ